MIDIIEIIDETQKMNITDEILHKLPNWFGIESSIQEYMKDVRDKIFYAAISHGKVIGFICLRHVNPFTAELFLVGILEEFHRQGIGCMLIGAAEEYLTKNEYKFFMVKTVGDSSDDLYYARTRAFYRNVGFFPLDEFKEIWNEQNPCLIMVKTLS